MNKVLLVGRIGRTPKITTPNDNVVANFSIATDEYYGGEKHTEWHNIVAWGKQAEFVGAYLSKGSLVEIEGRNQTRSWEDKDGNKRHTTEVVANIVKGLSKGDKDPQEKSPVTLHSANPYNNDDLGDSDIPF
jgi:single-strand DNA-binding protein